MDLSQGLTLFLLAGVAQGLFLAVLLLTRRENAAANRVLAGMMVAFAVFLAEVAIYLGGHYSNFPHLIGISQPAIYLFGPVIYLYARTISGGLETPGRRDLLHFVPAAVVTVYLLPFYLKSGSAKVAFVETLMRDGAPLYLEIIEWMKLPHGVVYTIVTFGVLGRYRRRLEQNFSTLDRINLGWLRSILVGAMVAWVVAITDFGLSLVGIRILGNGSNPTSLVLVVVVYMIGIRGLRQPEVFWPPSPAEDPTEGSPKEAAQEDAAPAIDAKYRKSGLDPAKAAAMETALLTLMDEQGPQEDSDLTLQQLADQLEVSPHNLSEVINARLGTSFHDFVNGYRVEEAKRRLLDPKLSHQTILAIAIDSGFRSKSTFNKIFKRFTGVTPSEFRRANATA
jgi:AraC-like DNA-binding protein